MIIEETDTLVEEPELLGLIRNSPSHRAGGLLRRLGLSLIFPTASPHNLPWKWHSTRLLRIVRANPRGLEQYIPLTL